MRELSFGNRMRWAGSLLDNTEWSDGELDGVLECLPLVIAFMEGAGYNSKRIIGPLRLDLQVLKGMKGMRASSRRLIALNVLTNKPPADNPEDIDIGDRKILMNDEGECVGWAPESEVVSDPEDLDLT